MKITKESDDIYTRNVTVEMTEAEWEFIIGLAAARYRGAHRSRFDAGRAHHDDNPPNDEEP